MNILINASNLKVGGGLQVADSLIKELYKFPHHNFIVVLPTALLYLQELISDVPNISFKHYDMRAGLWNVISGRNAVLDSIVSKNCVEAVLTVFGPSVWTPKVLHICGFARSQLCIPESPFFSRMSINSRINKLLRNSVNKYLFNKNSNTYFTENPFISEKLRTIFPHKCVYTVTNTYNQVFDNSSAWDKSIKLPDFEGVTLLTIAANYPHKNLCIIPKVVEYMIEYHSSFQFRFVLSIKKEEMPDISKSVLSHIIFLDRLDVRQCPYLYTQSDFMFLPTLLECFSASYAEAMRMNVPILTSNLEFASRLCGEAAEYFNPIDAASIGECIIRVSGDANLRRSMINYGHEILSRFDTAEGRAQKLVKIIERHSN